MSNETLSGVTALRVGYARVSTDDQGMALQLDALSAAGCERIYSEKISAGKVRPQLAECLRSVRRGDVLVVWRLDRLGRSLTELVAIVNDLAQRGIALQSLTEHIDTSSAAGKLTFHIFSAMAEFERNIIRERTSAGLKAARARGRVGGRPSKIKDKAMIEMKALYESGAVSVDDICARHNIGRSTFYRSVLGKTSAKGSNENG